jgi:SulP family sulfate permease
MSEPTTAPRPGARSLRVEGVLPGLAVLRRYDRGWLRGDLVAGVTVAAYLVPQVMAYATLAGLDPVTGLWAILIPLATYAFLGSSRQLSVGPESTTALFTVATIAPLAAGDPGRYAALAAALAVVVGGYFVLAWAARLGFLADLLSRPILVGYLAGVAALMVMSQIGKVTGVDVEGDAFFAQAVSLVGQLDEVNWPTVLLAAGVLVFLFVVQARFPRAPGPLIAVLLATVAVGALGLQAAGVAVVGPMPSGLPNLQFPAVTIRDLHSLLLPALGVVIVGYSDSITTSRAFARRQHQSIDANAELLALGVANVGAGLSQGFPVSSSASRTALGDAAGSRTQVHSLTAVACVVAVLLVVGPVLENFPVAALGALVIYAATRLVDLAEFRRLASFRRSEFAIAIATTAGVLVLDILSGLLLAIGISAVVLLARVARPHFAVLGLVPGLAGMHAVDDFADARTIPGLVVFRYDSPLFFANADDFHRRALDAVDEAEQPVRWFLLNAEANIHVDITALDALEDLRRELTERGVVVALARVKQELLADLRAAGLAQRIGEERIFPTLPTAVAGYDSWRAADGQQNRS